jgi:hypothetical protein
MASIQEYGLQNQLRTAGTNAVIQGNQQLQNVIGDVQERKDKKTKENLYRQTAAEAAQLWQSGQKQEAIGKMIQVDPNLATSVFGNLGKLETESQYGQLPTQVAAAKAAQVRGGGFKDLNFETPEGSVVTYKMEKGTGKIFDLAGDPVDSSTLAGFKAGYAPVVRTNPNTKANEVISKGSATARDVPESGAAIETAPDGSAVALTPKANDGLIKFTTEFNKDPQTKELVSQINNLNTAKAAIIKNVPGAGMLEKMRLIRGMTPRPAVQEVMALNYGQGWGTTFDGYLTKAAGEGLAPEEQKNFLNMVEVFQTANLDEYNQHLHSRVAQASQNYKVDPSIILKRVAPEMPTPIQEKLRAIQKLPPEDQKMIEMAHQYLLSHTRNDPDYKDALKVLQKHGL